MSKKRGNKPQLTVNIRNKSIFESTKTDLRILYFLLFYNFVENKSINQSYLNCKESTKQLWFESISNANIIKFYRVIREKIKNTMHKTWKDNLLGMESCENRKSYVEIDESKIVSYNGEVRWMFGLYERGSKEIRIFFVDNNRTKETLLPLIKDNVYTYYDHIRNNIDINLERPATRIYSDCFATYQVSDFNNLGYILHKVNHSIGFGYGQYHTNSIESTWGKLKRLTHSFNGLNGNVFNTRQNLNNQDYFDWWICTGLFFIECESLGLALNEKKKYLLKYLHHS